jgi:hypothetical protein
MSPCRCGCRMKFNSSRSKSKNEIAKNSNKFKNNKFKNNSAVNVDNEDNEVEVASSVKTNNANRKSAETARSNGRTTN